MELLKSKIVKGSLLKPFDTDIKRQTFLTTDASECGIGAVLEQRQDDGEVSPICFWSLRLRSYERNYSISEKEALACVSAMNKFRK